MVAAVKLREIKIPQSALYLESRVEVVAKGRGNTTWRTIEDTNDWLEVERLVRGFATMWKKQIYVPSHPRTLPVREHFVPFANWIQSANLRTNMNSKYNL